MASGLGLAAVLLASALVHDDVILRGEPFGPATDLSHGNTGELAQAVYRSRAAAVVAVNAAEGQGSGTVIRPDGWIVTCAHVTGGAATVQVVFHDGGTLDGHVAVADPVIDLALVKVDSDVPLPWIALADLSALEVGDPVIAIGHPKGFGWTVNQGIVSNLFVFRNGRHDPGVVQSQVPLNPGNSGGPLLDRTGRLVGVIAQGDPSAQSLNWSISARAVKEFVVRHSYALPDADLVVNAKPAGAEVFLDGKKIGAAPRATSRVSAGTHVVEVRKEGLGSVHSPLFVLQRTQAELDLRLAPAGTLAVSADTLGVSIYVDGVLRGEAPLSIDIAAGAHTVVGSKAGTSDSRARASVVKGEETEILLSNPSNRAFLTVASSPAGAEVVVDGESFGETPVDRRALSPGQHVIDVRVGESARRVVIELSPDVHRRIDFDLSPPAARAAAATSTAAPRPADSPRALAKGARSTRYWRGALALSIAGALVSSGSAAVLASGNDDPAIRAAAGAGVVGGAAAFSSGPAVFFWHTAPSRDVRADSADERATGAGIRFRF